MFVAVVAAGELFCYSFLLRLICDFEVVVLLVINGNEDVLTIFLRLLCVLSCHYSSRFWLLMFVMVFMTRSGLVLAFYPPFSGPDVRQVLC